MQNMGKEKVKIEFSLIYVEMSPKVKILSAGEIYLPRQEICWARKIHFRPYKKLFLHRAELSKRYA